MPASRIERYNADQEPTTHSLLGKVSNRIINEVRGINRVVYGTSGKPPATIEWDDLKLDNCWQ